MDSMHTGNATRSAFDRLVEQEWASLPAALQECGEIAVMRPAQALADAVANAASKMFDQANQSLTPLEREHWLSAADFARAIRLNLGHDFSRYFQAKYCHACKHPRVVPADRNNPFAMESLRVADQNTFGADVDADFMRQFSQFVARDSLQRVSECFATLLGVDLEPGDAPIGPRVISAALSDTFKIQPGHQDAKQRLLRTLHPEFLVRVNMLYRDMTSFMMALGFQSVSLSARAKAIEPGPAPFAASDALPTGVAQAGNAAPRFLSEPEAPQSVAAVRPSMAQFSLGDWIEYRQSGEVTRQLKLTWVSPLKSLFLWTTPEARRALCVSPDELTSMFESGRVRRIPAPDGVDIQADAVKSLRKIA